jgi:hypothetical protein
MNKGKHLIRLACILAVSTVSIYCTNLYGSDRILKDSSRTRADIIKIDIMNRFAPLEKPSVEFLHDAHTEALAKKNLDCTACHLVEKDRIFPKFKRIKDVDRIEVMNLYHKECISCHGEMKVAHEKSGPVECDGCHREKAMYSSSRQPMGFDKSLHFRHSEAQEKKCEVCHHEYDEKEKKLFYAKEKEGTCRYCHKTESKDKPISMRLASHIACVNCHTRNLANHMASGPVTCSGCHDLAAQQKIKKISPVPRMERKQPDTVLIKADQKGMEAGTEKLNRMNFVPFDHQVHEENNDSCRVCHHENLKPCNECHTLTGIKEGKEVNLENAMHQVDTGKSCLGCHSIKQEEKNCAGCHVFMSKTTKKESDSCGKCHMVPVSEMEKTGTPDDEKSLAAEMLRLRKPVTGTYHQDDIPEKVVIKNLSKQYEPVDFPHRKIVNALVNNIKDNRLSGYFHSQEGTICKGCHHNSPVSKKPPHCGNCHGKTFDKENPLKPGIMGAYHQQCMGCHQEMDIKKPAGCIDCHKEKKS